MAGDPATAARSLGTTASDLARRWATQRLAAVQSYGRILAEYGAGQASGRDSVQAYAKLVLDEATRYPTDAFGIVSDYARAVARAAGVSSAAVQAAAAAPPVIDVDLTGELGRTATRTIVIDNPHDTPAAIGFTATNFFDGDLELKAMPTVGPAEATIAAHGEQAVEIGAKIDRKVFKPGRTYQASVAVDGFDDLLIRIHLTVSGPG